MKQSAIKDLSTKELKEMVASEKAQLVKLRLGHAISPIENPKKISQTRKTVARLLTEINKREMQETSNTK